ncbi:MAG: acyl-CoA dehydrogenase family protein [Phycisphaerae bacterium]|nr:acyl-CoA dehydrogenase family protein [Phycisphaerae bacterium]
MEFELTEAQQALQDAAVRLARDELCDDMIQRDAERRFSREGWKKCAEFGVQGLPIPEEYGGSGADPITTIAVMEGLGYGGKDSGLIFSINAHLWTNSIPILKYGTDEQKRRYLPPLCDGSMIGANGVSEPDAGSDVFSMRTRVEKRRGEYVLNGAKIFVTNAPVADVFAVYGTMDPRLGPMGICAFMIEKGAPGLRLGKPMDKMGLRTSPMSELILEECVVPESARLGREGRGAEVFNCSMAWERACILASCVGVMRRQLEQCIQYARTRKQFNQPIGKFQSVANRIVDMKVRYETARLLIYKVGALMCQNRSADMDAAMAKLYVSDSFVKSSLDAVQIHGGSGYMTEMEVERDLRDSVGSMLYSGTSDIQRNIIARGLRI